MFTAVGWAFGHLRRYEDVIALALVAIVTVAVLIVTARNRKRVPGEIGGQHEAADHK